MATIFRPPLIFRRWPQDPNSAATQAQPGVTQDRNTALLRGQDTFPPGAVGIAPDFDYPNPKGPLYAIGRAIAAEAEVWRNRLVDLLRGQDAFFGGAGVGPDYDWPNPTLPKSKMASVRAQADVTNRGRIEVLSGQDAFFTGPGIGPDYDWPNPIRPAFAAGRAVFSFAETWTNRLANLLRGEDSFFAASGQSSPFDWPNPLRLLSRAAVDSQANVLSNALATLLAVVTIVTPALAENPRGSVSRVALLAQGANLIVGPLQGQDAVYSASGQAPAYDWANPSLRVVARQAESKGSATLSVLFKQDAIYSAPGESPAYDWSNPVLRVAIRQAESRSSSQLGTLLGQDVFYAAPGQAAAFDWPGPRSRRVQQLDPVPDILTTTLVGADALPAGEATQPSALCGAPRPPSVDYLGLLETTLVGLDARAVTVYDWPNPPLERTRRLSANDLQSDRQLNVLVGSDAFPARGETNWPNPVRGVARLNLVDYLDLLAGTLAASPSPFAQYDWPLARAVLYRQQQILFDALASTLVGQDQFFGVGGPAYDYPNPMASRPRLAALRATGDVQSDWLLSVLQGTDAFPARGEILQLNPPRAVVRLLVAEQFDLLSSLLGGVQLPFSQLDWPLIRAIVQRHPEITQELLTGGPLLGLDSFPARGDFANWPNPLLAVYRQFPVFGHWVIAELISPLSDPTVYTTARPRPSGHGAIARSAEGVATARLGDHVAFDRDSADTATPRPQSRPARERG